MENQINIGDQNSQQIGQNPVNRQVQIPEKSRVNYLVIGLVVLVCFVVFGSGGYYLGKQSNRSQNITTNNNTVLPTPLETSLPAPTTIETTPLITTDTISTVNWKTYTSTKLGFTLQYPQDWKLSELNDPLVIPGLSISPDCDHKKESVCPNISIDVAANTSKEDFDKLINYDKSFPGFLEEVKYKIDNIDTIELRTASKRFEGEYIERGAKVFIFKNNTHYYISYNESYTINLMNIDLKKELPEWKYKIYFDKILSTFKFVE